MDHDDDPEIHDAKKNAYEAVLRAFMYQSDEISPEKQILLEGLKKELKVSDDEHGELLDKLVNDDTVKCIRELRKEKTDSSSHQLARERRPKTRSINEIVYGIKAEDLGVVFRPGDGGLGHNDQHDSDDDDSADYDPKSDK